MIINGQELSKIISKIENKGVSSNHIMIELGKICNLQLIEIEINFNNWVDFRFKAPHQSRVIGFDDDYGEQNLCFKVSWSNISREFKQALKDMIQI